MSTPENIDQPASVAGDIDTEVEQPVETVQPDPPAVVEQPVVEPEDDDDADQVDDSPDPEVDLPEPGVDDPAEAAAGAELNEDEHAGVAEPDADPRENA